MFNIDTKNKIILGMFFANSCACLLVRCPKRQDLLLGSFGSRKATGHATPKKERRKKKV